MSTYEEMVKGVRGALERRDSRRDVLAARVLDMIVDAAGAVRVRRVDCGEGGVVAMERVEAQCCQGGLNSGWPILTQTERHWVLLGAGDDAGVRSFGSLDLTYHDGHNLQVARTSPRLAGDGAQVRPATVAQLRALARALPEVLARLLSEAQATATAETAAADETIETLAAGQ